MLPIVCAACDRSITGYVAEAPSRIGVAASPLHSSQSATTSMRESARRICQRPKPSWNFVIHLDGLRAATACAQRA